MNHRFGIAVAACALAASTALAGIGSVGSTITYQGQLRDAGGPINGSADLLFSLFQLPVGGGQVGPTLTVCNVTLEDGLFTTELDFGAAAFDGSPRWLQISVRTPSGGCPGGLYAVLSPRQNLTATPYAVRSLAPWETNGSSIHYPGGNVGIGTTTPDTLLELNSSGDSTLRVTSVAANGTSNLDLKGDAPSGLSTNSLGAIRFVDETNTVRAQLSSSLGFLASPFVFSVDGVAHMALTSTGNLGVGTTLPLAKLQLVGGTDSEPSTGGFAIIGETMEANISIDNNEIMARNDGAVSTLFINNDGGDVSILAGGAGQVGIGLSPTTAQLTVFNSLFVTGGASPRIDVAPNGFILMDSNADIVITDGGLEVNTPSAGSTFFNRTAPDGTLVGFRNDGTTAGNISVIGSTVSYNTFTGSHHAWTATPIEHGALVVLTGENQRAHEGPNCEPVYGIAPSSSANSSRCMGAYLCPPDAADPDSRHLVASVGNGEMWVTESVLGDLEPGDALISSDLPGAAMKDDPSRFAVGHVIARAAEGVRWSAVRAGPDGSKRVLLSVFFESFERQGDAAALAETIASLEATNAALQARLDALEAALAGLSPAVAKGARP